MAVFRFHLQKILDLKEKEQEQAEWAFGKSVQKKTEEEEKLVHLHHRRDQLTDTLHKLQEQACTAAKLIEMNQFRLAIDKAIVQQVDTISACDRNVESCKRTMTSKMQENQLWSKLKEKERLKYDEAAKYREQQILDEIGLVQYVRR
ncbi:flagellar export protein FliJ [Brevibacillus fluminis]|uniref:Flagellar FliJ protein n=1 Tax=Brevibacillus fluminis TaxID=511487 RepID=A0A3M8DUV9_9BACL|nr:flagellar export protein FliJ [Brevibacillus fluminis]RNB91876.1 flagellar export protein FliJ [Brevibacillus fluminis]